MNVELTHYEAAEVLFNSLGSRRPDWTREDRAIVAAYYPGRGPASWNPDAPRDAAADAIASRLVGHPIGGALYTVETGVRGASRINRREYATLDEAVAAAERWGSSNSTGEYWAAVFDPKGVEVKRVNLDEPKASGRRLPQARAW